MVALAGGPQVDLNDKNVAKPGMAGIPELLIQIASTSNSAFQPNPIDPTWILEGTPTARSLNLAQSSDGLLSCGLWDCTAGKFNFSYFCDEIVHILEGEVHVQQGGAEFILRPGDVALFPEGLTACWTVPHYVRKFCIHRSRQRTILEQVRAKVKRILHAIFRPAQA